LSRWGSRMEESEINYSLLPRLCLLLTTSSLRPESGPNMTP
jgi:hypothetical protein